MLRYVPLVWKNSRRNMLRSVLTLLSIAASLCLLGMLMAMYHAFFLSEPTDEKALRLLTRNRISLVNTMPVAYTERIRQVPGVKHVMVMQWFGGVYKEKDFKTFFARFAAEPDRLFDLYPEFKTSEEERKAFQGERTACMVGRSLLARFGWKLGDRITLMGDIYPVDLTFTIRAIYDSPRDNENLYFHYAYLREAVPEARRDAVSTFVIFAKDRAAVDTIPAAVDRLFRDSPAETKTETEQAFQLSFLNYLGNVKRFLLAISGAVMFMLLLVSGNTMAMSVRERVREVGVLKTLGFSPGIILGLILGESTLIACAGAILGLVLSVGVCALLRTRPTSFADLKGLYLTPGVIVAGLGVAGFIAVSGSIGPAWGAARRSIVSCLRVTD